MSGARRISIGLTARVFAVALALLLWSGHSSFARADTTPQPVDLTHSVASAPAPDAGTVWSYGPAVKTGTAICTNPTSAAANVNTDCEGVGAHNETSIAVNPTNADNMIGGANDYQLSINPGGHINESILSRAHVTFDGGKTWSTYPVFSNSSYNATGDPSLAFDAAGHAYYATLGFRYVSKSNYLGADLLVAGSGDGGRTWSVSRVAAGSGSGGSVGDFLDKEYVAAWGDGNSIVTWGDFRQGQKGSPLSAKIYDSVTHDAGATWSAPQLVSGSLDQSFGSDPVVASDGRVYVAFLNTDDLNTGRDTYKLVEVDPNTGRALTAPFSAARVYDGNTDSPFASGRETYHDSQLRSSSIGNVVADPTNPAHLAIVFSDWRDGQIPSPSDPYLANTNADVMTVQSFDRGRSWMTSQPIQLAGDQWMPWGVFDSSGRLRIGTFDRSSDPANQKYDYALLTQSPGGAFTATTVSTVASDPTKNDRWFAQTVQSAFPDATTFLGDYSNIALIPGSNGTAAYWTDMRNQVCFAGRCGHSEDAYFARLG